MVDPKILIVASCFFFEEDGHPKVCGDRDMVLTLRVVLISYSLQTLSMILTLSKVDSSIVDRLEYARSVLGST